MHTGGNAINRRSLSFFIGLMRSNRMLS
uniref:Uncharacterized protein n=1 Tax=Anguilla anguilla TaxID=7936 RepID=A0A0E9UHB3_ANGAN